MVRSLDSASRGERLSRGVPSADLKICLPSSCQMMDLWRGEDEGGREEWERGREGGEREEWEKRESGRENKTEEKMSIVFKRRFAVWTNRSPKREVGEGEGEE